jgi:CheY-like chemotaxis protein
MRVLLLADNPTLAHSFALRLSLEGYSVLALTSPHDVLKLIQETDTLVTDYHLPDMTGLEVARRAYDHGWRGPLLLMSGHVATVAEEARHPLPQSILQKPFSVQELIEALGPKTSKE